MATKPFTEHLPYPLYGTEWEVEADREMTEKERRRMWRNHYQAAWDGSLPAVRGAAVAREFERSAGDVKVRRLTARRVVFEIAPYPDSSVREVSSTIWVIMEGTQTRYIEHDWGVDPTARFPFWVRAQPVGFRQPRVEVEFTRGLSAQVLQMPGEWVGDRFYFWPPEPGHYFTRFVIHDPTVGPSVAFAGPQFYVPNSGPWRQSGGNVPGR